MTSYLVPEWHVPRGTLWWKPGQHFVLHLLLMDHEGKPHEPVSREALCGVVIVPKCPWKETYRWLSPMHHIYRQEREGLSTVTYCPQCKQAQREQGENP